MPTSKLDYLSKYTGESLDKKSKKKKKSRRSKEVTRTTKENDTLPVVDLDENDPVVALPRSSADQEEDEDEDQPVVVADIPASTLLSARGTWETEAGPSSPVNVQQPSQQQQQYSNHQSDSDQNHDHSGHHRSSTSTRRRRHDSESEASSSPSSPRAKSPSPTRNPRRRHDSDDDDDDSANKDDHQNNRSQSSGTGISTRESRRQRHDSDDDSDLDHHDRPPITTSSQRRRYDSSPSPSPSTSPKPNQARMASGHKAGLQKYDEFTRSETMIQARKRQEAQQLLDQYGMGETVYRDQQGRRRQTTPGPDDDVDHSKAASSSTKTPTRIQLDPTAQQLLNVGKVQREQALLQEQDFQNLQQSAFARHQDDDQLEEIRKSQIRKGDPMAEYAINKKRHDHDQDHHKKKSKKSKKNHHHDSSPTNESIPIPLQKPIYKGPPPKPNRYNIKPGYRWDGVDRGNGFEDKLLAKQFSAHQQQEEAYRYRSADM